MMRKIKKNLFYMLLSLTVLMIWGSGIYYGQYVKDYYQSISIRMKEDKVTKKDIIRALENESKKGTKKIPTVTAWNRRENKTIENRGLATNISVSLIEVYGDMKQVYPMELLDGSLLNPDDYEGCVIDETVAYELYRTHNAVGNFITYENRQYYIRGIIKSMEPSFIIQISNEENAYSNLELVYMDKESGEQPAHDFIIQNDLASTYTMIEGSFYGKVIELFTQFPTWLLGFSMLFQIIKSMWKRRTLPLQVLILLVSLVIAWIVLQWFVEFQIYIPERLIPTKWSNFSFWVKKYSSFRNQMEQISYLIPVPKDMILFKYITKCIQSILITLVSIIVFITHKKVFLEKSSGIKMSFLIIILECVAMFLLFKTGKVYRVTKGYLCILPLFVMSVDFVNRGKMILISLVSEKFS